MWIWVAGVVVLGGERDLIYRRGVIMQRREVYSLNHAVQQYLKASISFEVDGRERIAG